MGNLVCEGELPRAWASFCQATGSVDSAQQTPVDDQNMAAASSSSSPTAYERWLMPQRPGLRQFLIAVGALLLPVACLGQGDSTYVPALVISLTVGCGLGLAWAVVAGWSWLRRAPVNAVCIFVTCFGSIANLELMPRWDTLIRAREAMADMQFYVHARNEGHATPLRSYDAGPTRATFSEEITATGQLVFVCTPEPIQRWSPFGFRPSCYVLVRGDGTGVMAKTAEILSKAQREARATLVPPKP